MKVDTAEIEREKEEVWSEVHVCVGVYTVLLAIEDLFWHLCVCVHV